MKATSVLGNIVNFRDVQLLLSRLPTRAAQLVKRTLLSGRGRTIETYSRPVRNDQWWSVPAIQRRWNTLISGDPAVDHYSWIANKHLGAGLRGLSVGCGEGARELAWARTGRFSKILGVDLTPAAIDSARRNAKEAGLDSVVEFRVADVADPKLNGAGDESFDVVIGEHSVHHITPLRRVLLALRDRLEPGGLFLLNEFVGPTRFQWTAEQMRAINRLLPLLPVRLRRKADGHIKAREYRPSLLYMVLNDPSEAVESSMILPTMNELFEQVEIRPYGGTLLHLLLSKIGHNFEDGDQEAQAWLSVLAQIEDRMLASKMLEHDFAVAVYRKAS
ncbi:MAG TPA: class I SAM-dependent methyltransferase [Planctomycetota bacterium]|nr:class I SAM-dependent methyltransferase [Planctomycetota bacterium]